MLNLDVLIGVEQTMYIGTVTNATEKYFNFQGNEMKTNVKIASKFYKNELDFIGTLKKRQIESTTELVCDFTLQDLCFISKKFALMIFIERFDRKYFDAIADIESESFFGFYMPGVENGRFDDTSIMAFSTSTRIYVIDVQVMGRIEKELKNILQSNFPKKIVHDASRLADHLQHKQNIILNGVFDTMVAGSGCSIEECLENHLRLPHNFIDPVNREQWRRRPLSTNLKNVAAQNVVFLQKLHSKMTKIALKSAEERS